MKNLSKLRRSNMLSYLNQLKEKDIENNSSIIIKEIEQEITNKKYGLVWEEHYEKIDLDMKTKVPVFKEIKNKEIVCNNSKPYNFLLEGDNLHSLKLLEKTHKKKIDVIYIDPPYNTGAKDWKYDNNYVDKEDGFRHSKWLSMMHKRITIAKSLLTDEGTLVCAIDENELATTLLLLNDIFGDSYKIDCITIIHNPRGVQGKNFSYVHEYAIFVYNKAYKVIGNKSLEPDEIKGSNFRNWGGESLRTDAKNCFYPVIVKNNEIIGFGEVVPDDIHPTSQSEYIEEDDTYLIYPIDKNGIERKWRYAYQTVESIRDSLKVKKNNGRYEIEIEKDFEAYKTVWTDKKFDANEYGTQLINSMIKDNDIDFPKSLYRVYECLYALIKDKPNATVLDFFAGSGTTGHAVLLMNKNLGGNRKFILCTNNDVGEKREKEFKKKYGSVKEFELEWNEWKNYHGIASSITYPRIKSAIEGYSHSKDFKDILLEKKLTLTDLKKAENLLKKIEEIQLKEKDNYSSIKTIIEDGILKVLGIIKKNSEIAGIPANLKYFKTEYIDKQLSDTNTEYDIYEALLSHIREMIELEYSININDTNYKIIMTDDDIDNFCYNLDNVKKCKKIYRSTNVLFTKEQEILFNQLGIEIITIPEYYFPNELRELVKI